MSGKHELNKSMIRSMGEEGGEWKGNYGANGMRSSSYFYTSNGERRGRGGDDLVAGVLQRIGFGGSSRVNSSSHANLRYHSAQKDGDSAYLSTSMTYSSSGNKIDDIITKALSRSKLFLGGMLKFTKFFYHLFV